MRRLGRWPASTRRSPSIPRPRTPRSHRLPQTTVELLRCRSAPHQTSWTAHQPVPRHWRPPRQQPHRRRPSRPPCGRTPPPSRRQTIRRVRSHPHRASRTVGVRRLRDRGQTLHHGSTRRVIVDAHDVIINQENSLPLCDTHDIWKHRKQLRGRRDKHGRIHLVKPDGTVIKPLNAHDPIWAEPDEVERNEASSGEHQSSRLFTPDWQTFAAAEWATEYPNLASRPDPGWTISVADLRAA